MCEVIVFESVGYLVDFGRMCVDCFGGFMLGGCDGCNIFDDRVSFC